MISTTRTAIAVVAWMVGSAARIDAQRIDAQRAALAAAARRVTEAADEAQVDAAIATLRAAGPRGLAVFQEVHGLTGAPAADREPTALHRRVRAARDRIGAQRDNVSGLYWFTDLELARTEARRSGRPILSLRLLGRLDEELSCANSRFFRVALYANAEVSRLLREGFVLHWASERPVPRVTIDYGDGRKLERTITGNSLHWVLDPDGNVVDALPGLYGPGAFARELEAARAFVTHASRSARRVAPREHAVAVLTRLQPRNAVLATDPSSAIARSIAAAGAVTTVPAPVAAVRAESKIKVERPLLPVAMGAAVGVPDPIGGVLGPTPGLISDCRLDASSLALLRAKCPPEVRGNALALRRTVQAFEQSMVQDTFRNDGELRPAILARVVASPASVALAEINAWVYASVFLTPGSDPWLGLVTPEVFTAIENGGIESSGVR